MVRRSVPSICKLEVQFKIFDWQSGVSLNVSTRSMLIASYFNETEIDTSVEIEFPPNENELRFEFKLDKRDQKLSNNGNFTYYNITVRQIQCSNELKVANVEYEPEYEDNDSFCNDINTVEYDENEFMIQSPNYPRRYPNSKLFTYA